MLPGAICLLKCDAMQMQVDALATFTANSGLCQEFCNLAGHWTAVGKLAVISN